MTRIGGMPRAGRGDKTNDTLARVRCGWTCFRGLPELSVSFLVGGGVQAGSHSGIVENKLRAKPSPSGQASPEGGHPPHSLEIRRLTKAYGEHLAINNVSISVARGEFLTLLGPSGSGKTTMLMAIAGFVAPTRGRSF